MAVQMFVSDFSNIEHWTVEDHNEAHTSDLAWLNHEVSSISQQDASRKIIIFTHHSPTLNAAALDPKHEADAAQVRSGFATDLSNEVCWTSPQVKLWAFGHTHFNCDFNDPRTGKRVCANQKGYRRAEEVDFDPLKVVECEEIEPREGQPMVRVRHDVWTWRGNNILSHNKLAEIYTLSAVNIGNKASKLFKKPKSPTLGDPIDEKFSAEASLPGSSLGDRDSRYDVCTILTNAGFSNVIWLEDLVALHGSDSVVWDLHLLVRDPDESAQRLMQAGYHRIPPDVGFQHVPEINMRGVRLRKPSSSDTAVVLMPAEDWYYSLNTDVPDCLPPINSFLDSLAEVWLNVTTQDYIDHLRYPMYLACLINYCYSLIDTNGARVKSIEYAQYLKPEHRELHYDIVSGGSRKETFTSTARHQYHARRSREIKDGTFSPMPYHEGKFKPPLITLKE